MNISKLVVGVLFFYFLTGCARFHNEGATTYGYHETQQNKINEKGLITNARYYRAIKEPSNLITKEDAFSITLISAHICDFDEFSVSAVFRSSNRDTSVCKDSVDWFDSPRKATQGEIAIIANAGEKKISIGQQELEDQGRIIYYNKDVRASGHVLNFLNIPIYGPIKYEGKPFSLEFLITELDNEENEQAQVILSQLASIGSIAYPPAAPILSVLNSLGGALIKSNKDDILLTSQTKFDVSEDTVNLRSTTPKLYLREGYYAFVREEHRSTDTLWSSIHVNEKSGLLVHNSDHLKTFRDKTWLLVRISKESDTSVAELEAGQALAEFRQRLSHDSIDLTSSMKTLKAGVEKLTEKKAAK